MHAVTARSTTVCGLFICDVITVRSTLIVGFLNMLSLDISLFCSVFHWIFLIRAVVVILSLIKRI